MNYQLNCIYYVANLNVIGGLESHLYYLAKRYQDRDFTIVINSGDSKQIQRLRRLVQVVKITPQDIIECDTAFLTYTTTTYKNIKAKHTYFVIHADYEDQIKYGTLPKGSNNHINGIDKVFAVSGVAKNGWNKEDDVEVLYMPIDLDEFEEPILLMSATRLTKEKGLERMKTLAKALDKAKVNYLWHVYTNSNQDIKSDNVQFMKPRLDVISKMPLYDGFVQLSDSEAFCVSIQEASLNGLALITTPLPLIDEMKLNDRSIILPFDMTNIDKQVEQIRNIKRLKESIKPYKMPKDKWDKLLTGKSTYKDTSILVRATTEWQQKNIKDADTLEIHYAGEEWLVSQDRYNQIKETEERLKVKLIDVV